MEWKVELDGDKKDLGALAQSLRSSELAVTREGDTFFLESDQFRPDDDGNENYSKALDLVEKLHGALRLEFNSTKPLSIRAVHERSKDGGHYVYVQGKASCVTTTRVIVGAVTVRSANGTAETSYAADPIRDWMSIQNGDEAAAQVLRMLAKENNWVNLYRIFEVVLHDCGGEAAIASHGWANKRAMELFRRTANSPTAIGLEARHGSQTTAPPRKPMSVRKARLLIEKLAREWLRWKVERVSGSGAEP